MSNLKEIKVDEGSAANSLVNNSISTLDISNNYSVDIELPSEVHMQEKSFTKKLGKCYAFLYYKSDPIFVIGPDCK